MQNIVIILMICSALISSNINAQNDFTVDIQVLVNTGDASPDGNGVFANQFFVPPMLNNQSQVLVWSSLVATTDPTTIDDFGYFRVSPQTNVVLARGGMTSATGSALRIDQQAINANGNSFAFNQQGLSDDGTAILIIPDNTGAWAMYAADEVQLQTLLQDGQMTAFGTVSALLNTVGLGVQVNDLTQASLPLFVDSTGIVSARIDSTSQQSLFAPGDPLPDGRTVSSIFGSSIVGGMNNSGNVMTGITTSNSGPITLGYYLTDGINTTKLLHTGEPAVDGLGSYSNTVGFTAIPHGNISNNGMAVIAQGVDDISNDYRGLFFYDGVMLNEWLRTGETLSGIGQVITINAAMFINNQATGLFSGRLETGAGAPVETVLIRHDGIITKIFSDFDQLAEPIDLQVRAPFSYALNAQGQVLLFGFVIADGVSREALFLYDRVDGLALIARVGMPFNGDTISDLNLALSFANVPSSTVYTSNATNAFNDLGEAAFAYTLSNGESGIALANVEFIDEDILLRDGFENNF